VLYSILSLNFCNQYHIKWPDFLAAILLIVGTQSKSVPTWRILTSGSSLSPCSLLIIRVEQAEHMHSQICQTPTHTHTTPPPPENQIKIKLKAATNTRAECNWGMPDLLQGDSFIFWQTHNICVPLTNKVYRYAHTSTHGAGKTDTQTRRKAGKLERDGNAHE